MDTELKEIVNDPTLPFDQALIKVDPQLKYAEVMKVIDIFSRSSQGDQDQLLRAGPDERGPAVSRGRPASLFRGGELPGLSSSSVVLAGWPMILLFARPKAEPPRPAAARRPPPARARQRLEFQALIDKTPIRPARERRLRGPPRAGPRDAPRELAADARRDVFYTHLWERPELYRGVPVHLEGTAKVLPHEVNPGFTPRAKLFEAWFVTPENRPFPYVVMFEDAPAGLPVGHDLNQRVTFDGYFLKLLRYQAGDADRAAPLLVGRLRRLAADGTPAPPVPRPAADAGKGRWNLTVAAVLGALGVYVAIRLVFQVRRVMAPSARRPSLLAPDRPAEEIAPEALADWLANVPDEDEGKAPEHSP